MNRNLLASLLIFCLISLPAQAAPCNRKGFSNSNEYRWRDNDLRCEGIKPFNASGSFSLISFAIGRARVVEKLLTLLVPNQSNNQEPRVTVLSYQKNYQLNPLALQRSNVGFKFKWSNAVLDDEEIPLDSLRALAFVRPGSQNVYIPVILGKSQGKYEFVLYSAQRAKISSFQIRQGRVSIWQTERKMFQPAGQLFFTWDGRTRDGRTAPTGRYTLRVAAELEQDNRQPERKSINVAFDHNPNWLK